MTGASGARAGPPFERVRSVFEAALERSPEEREPFLREACAGDPALRNRVESLLRAHQDLENGGGFGPGVAGELDPVRAAALVEPEGPRPSPGDRVGRYHIVRSLGQGGMGVVYLARDPELERTVALKFLPPVHGGDAAAAARLLDEARAASRLDHPNIGTVHEVGEGPGGQRYIAMAAYEGGTLRDRLRSGALPSAAALRVAREVAEGLAAAHARGIIHRDIKPENLVFDGDGRVKIVDFGLADGLPRRDGARRMTGGTGGYVSPEIRDGSEASDRADVWALGVVLHEMLTGARPPDGVRPPLSSWTPGVSVPVRRVAERCLHPDPVRRPSAQQVVLLLQRLTAPPALPRRRLWAGGGVVAAVALFAGFLAARGLPRIVEATGWAPGAVADRGWVLVADFQAEGGGEAPGVALAAREALSVDLQQSGLVSVLGRGQAVGILGRMGLPPDTPLELPVALEVAERAGAGAVLTATLSQVGSRWVLAGRALDPSSGSELFAVRTTASTGRVLGAVERLSREMRRRLGEAPEALRLSRPLPEVSTPSLEALRLYAEAERELIRDGPRAEALLQAAVELDSTFAMAHRMAGAVAYTALRFGEATLHLERAYRFRERLPERERWHLEAFHHAQVTFQPDRAAAVYELLLARYPRDPGAWNNLGVIRQAWLDDHEGAQEAFLRGVEVEQGLGMVALRNAVAGAFILGDLAASDSLAALAGPAGLDAFTQRWWVYRAFATGDHAVARTGCEELLAGPPGPPSGADELEVCGSMDVASGRVVRGIERLEGAAERALAEGRHRNIAHAAQGMALAEVLRGNPGGAAGRLEMVLERVPALLFQEPDRYLTRVNLRIQAALLGEDELLERIGRAYPPHRDPDHWLPRSGEGLVAAAAAVRRGDGAGALRILDDEVSREFRALGWRIWEELIRGWALEAVGDLDGAASAFARAADPGFMVVPAFTKDRLHRPVALDALARVEAARGNEAGARAAREELLTLWGNADREFPGVPRDPLGLASSRPMAAGRAPGTRLRKQGVVG